MNQAISQRLFSLRNSSAGAILKSAIIILLGITVFYVDDRDFFNYRITLGIIIALSLLKSFYFVSISYQKILEVSIKNTAYYEFILFMATHIFVIIISFAADFFCLVQVDPRSITGINQTAGLFEKAFDCFYFSVLNFSFFGYGDIIPVTIPAKLILMVEALLSFMAIILVLSDFISLKESLVDRHRKN
ncbi:MAG TPA: ion channel [Bacteroidia bacterium]|nr:ion channel [Bacteroidia bacterium]